MKFKFLLSFAFIFQVIHSQEFIPLWPQGSKPNFNGKIVTDSLYNERIWRVGTPGIYTFIVPRSDNKQTSVLICPGGSYERLSYLYNGFDVAKWFNTIGVNAFVLIYRLPNQQDLVNRELAPLQDAQRAMRIIRSNAGKWNIRADKIGVMATSAGGHVATTLYTHPEDVSRIKDNLDSINYNVDFMVLLSPVITMGKNAHPGSKRNFLGPDSAKAIMVEKYSNELHIQPSSPPVFLAHALNDSTVKMQYNSLPFYNALIEKKVNASLHIFPQGGHGIKIDDSPGSTDLWLNLLELWLKEMKLIDPLGIKK